MHEYLKRPNLARFPFVFVIAYGRSGSTLLNGILNSIDGYDIRGENHSTLLALFEAAKRYKSTRDVVKGKTDPSDPWYGAETLDPDAFSQTLASLFFRFVLQPQRTTRCLGFKEVRYTKREITDETFFQYLDFLQTIFPGAALIFNKRSTSETIKSEWWACTNSETVTKELDETAERFKSYVAMRSDCFLFDYNALIENVMYCKNLFDFLGESFDLMKVKAVLRVRHSY